MNPGNNQQFPCNCVNLLRTDAGSGSETYLMSLDDGKCGVGIKVEDNSDREEELNPQPEAGQTIKAEPEESLNMEQRCSMCIEQRALINELTSKYNAKCKKNETLRSKNKKKKAKLRDYHTRLISNITNQESLQKELERTNIQIAANKMFYKQMQYSVLYTRQECSAFAKDLERMKGEKKNVSRALKETEEKRLQDLRDVVSFANALEEKGKLPYRLKGMSTAFRNRLGSRAIICVKEHSGAFPSDVTSKPLTSDCPKKVKHRILSAPRFLKRAEVRSCMSKPPTQQSTVLSGDDILPPDIINELVNHSNSSMPTLSLLPKVINASEVKAKSTLTGKVPKAVEVPAVAVSCKIGGTPKTIGLTALPDMCEKAGGLSESVMDVCSPGVANKTCEEARDIGGATLATMTSEMGDMEGMCRPNFYRGVVPCHISPIKDTKICESHVSSRVKSLIQISDTVQNAELRNVSLRTTISRCPYVSTNISNCRPPKKEAKVQISSCRSASTNKSAKQVWKRSLDTEDQVESRVFKVPNTTEAGQVVGKPAASRHAGPPAKLSKLEQLRRDFMIANRPPKIPIEVLKPRMSLVLRSESSCAGSDCKKLTETARKGKIPDSVSIGK